MEKGISGRGQGTHILIVPGNGTKNSVKITLNSSVLGTVGAAGNNYQNYTNHYASRDTPQNVSGTDLRLNNIDK